jgi:hypothetical protein
MHIYDPNGAIREYRRKRDREASNRAILFAVGCVCVLIFIVCAVNIGLSLIGK